MPASTLPHLLDASMFWAATGGVRRVVAAKHDRLGAFGWRHTVLAPGAHGPGCIDCGGLLLPGTGGYRFVLRRGRAQRQIEAAAPDMVEAADPYVLAWSALAAAERLQVPAVAFCHSHLPALAARLAGGPQGPGTRRGRWAARHARRYLVELYRHFDLVLAPSAALARALRAWGVPRVAHQPLGVDCRIFHPAARDSAWRRTWCLEQGLKPDTRLLVYTGRFAPEKNLQLLADAVGRLGAGHRLLVVGSGPLQPHGPGVLALPPCTDDATLARLVASCDAYVHAGDQETFGLGVLEAMACGTPVVASGAGGLGELVEGAGTRVMRQDVREWAEAIEACLAHAGPVDAALARAREHDWPQVLARWCERYAALVRLPAHAGQAGHAGGSTAHPVIHP